MKKTLLFLLLLTASMTGFSKVWTITNSGITFNPDTITIAHGDTVVFKLQSFHDAQEVTETAYLANDSTHLAGFITHFGGDTIFPGWLTVGKHFFVCKPHASLGMKGLIIVESPTAVFSHTNIASQSSAYPNPFSTKMIIETPDADVISIFNAAGVSQISVAVPKGQTKIEIDATTLVSGTYLCSIFKNGAIIDTKKIIKN
jgi:plastocyanin